MGGLVGFLYGLVAYAVFLVSFLYAIGFVGNILVPKSIDSGEPGPLAEAMIVNTLLLGLFAVQHSAMAREGFKRWGTRFLPASVERSTYVLLASLVLLLLYWQWRPIPDAVWTVENPIPAMALQAIFWLGWGLLLISTFLISHFEMFGLAQVFARLRGRELPPPVFKTPFLYRRVRHPIYLSFLLAFWATPSGGGAMTRFVCGYFGCERHADRMFLAGLPSMFKINIRNDAAGRWLESSIQHLVSEAEAGRPGGAVLLAKMAMSPAVRLRSGAPSIRATASPSVTR
jgi:methanethiol S-methyltransferase